MTVLNGSCGVQDLRVGACQIIKRYVGSCVVWDVSAVLGPVFWANSYDLGTFEMLGVRTGVGGLTEARAYEIEVPDYQGQYVTVPGGQPAWEGARWDTGVAYADNGSGALLDPLPKLASAPQATSYFLNSQAPVTQTISGRSGVHTVWLEGAGSVAVSGGLTGTVTDGTPLIGDPAGADLILTVTGTPDFVQVEDNAFPTYPIFNAGAPETRDACAISYDSANHDDTEGTYLIEVDLSGDSAILNGFLSVENGLATLTDGVNTTVAPKLHPETMGLVYGTEGLRVTADGVQSALVPYDGTLLSGALDLFRASTVVQKSGEIKRYSVADQSIVDSAMPAPPAYTGIVLAVKTTTADETFTLPCVDTGVYDATIDWGDGSATSSITAWDDADLTHTYSEPGIRNVTITGDLPQIYFNNGGDKDKVVGLLSADSVSISYSYTFNGCSLAAVVEIVNPNVTTFSNCFRSNNLTSIPSGLFDNTPNVTDFLFCLFGNNLTAIPSVLFDNTPNVTTFSNCFRSNNLTSIPSGLFDNTPNVTNFSYCFRSNNLTSIPSGLFDNTPNVTNFSNCFYINNLTAIPSGLFDNTPNVTDFSHCFRSNNLTSIPSGLFDNCVVATNYSLCFNGCNLTQQSTDNVLVSIDTAGATNGTLDIDGAQPSATGQAAKTSLEGKGWTVTVTTP